MSYCFNPACPQPQNPDQANFCQTCGTPLLLKGRYRALTLLGQGGFGRTFLAIDQAQSAQRCVIKQLLPRSTVVDQATIDRFRQEAERLAMLGQHPQIPGLLAHFEQGTAHYLVQDYVAGDNLEAIVRRDGSFSERQIRALLADLLPVLHFIHQQAVIHRDLKPDNIIRPRNGDHYVLVDFGASKAIDPAALQQTGTVIGSAGYVAPEQAMGKAEFASDLYSLGVTCIHLLTGMHPFELYSVSEDEWVWPHYLPQPISTRLRRVLTKLLQRATKQRYRTAAEVMQDLGLAEVLPESFPAPLAASSQPVSSTPSRPALARPRSATPRTPRSPVAGFVPHRSPPSPLLSPVSATWQHQATLTGHTGDVTCLAISPGGRIIVSGGSDQTIRFWSLATGEALHQFPGRSFRFPDGHGDRLRQLVIRADGQMLFSGSDDGTVKAWDLNRAGLLDTWAGHGWNVSAIALSPNGQWLASGSGDGLIQLWQVGASGPLQADLLHHQAEVSRLLFSANGRYLISSSYDQTICVWDRTTQQCLRSWTAHTDAVTTIALGSSPYLLLSGSRDRTLKFWDWTAGEQLKVIAAHAASVTDLAIHPSGQSVASSSEDSTIKLWDLDQGDRLATLSSFWGINAVAFNPDGDRLVSGNADGTLQIWHPTMPI